MRERFAIGQNLSYHDLQAILDAVPIPVSWATVPDGRITFTNRAFTTLFGYSKDKLSTVDAFMNKFYVTKKQRELAQQLWQNMRTAASGVAGEIEAIELNVICSDGSVRIIHQRGTVLRDIGIGISIFEDVTDRKNAEATLQRLAFEDPLTGLGTRRLLQSRWSDLVSSRGFANQVAAVLMIDLDGFKQINDRFGHDAGDTVLQAVGNRLRASVRKDDLICRIGGDEFVILLHNMMTFEQVEQICWRIGAELTQAITVAGRSVQVGSSIGASIYPQDGESLEELIKHADEALYRVKTAHKGGWQWFRSPTAA